ncbi:PadR family transcriptional regulator [Candidatus Gracilibacteria bacterium GN02-872]|nr:PadR family transcriptional regulator [Candidatus Gracilibacteria bacterium GN02-872]RKW22091.1 MAG: PadR family transcriptional regulator [Candidatus Gracilibacteria bacterium]
MENKIQSQMRKGILDFLILGILKKGETYGAEIIETLKESDLIVVEGTVYPLLSRLIKDSMISYYWVESDSGHPRKYFKLTKSGEDAFDLMGKSWSEIKNTVQKILEK